MKLGLLLITIFMLGACAKNPANNKLDFVTTTKSDEYKIGREYRLAKISNSSLLKNYDFQIYVQKLGANINLVAERPEQQLTFYVVNSDIPNAYAVPGYVIVNRGLMPFLQDEAALSSVLAHEVGHITARHMVKDKSRIFIYNWLLNSFKPSYVKIKNDDVVKTAMLHNSRKDELEADLLAVRYLKKLNIPAENAMMYHKSMAIKEDISFKLFKLNKENKDKSKNDFLLPEYKSTHPHSAKREKAIANATDKWFEFLEYYKQKEYYKQIDGLSYGYDGKNISGDYEIADFKSVKSGVFGYKNTLYLKKAKLKINLPADYQARVMSAEPVAYNYVDDITVGFKQVSDDKHIYAIDIIAEMLNLTDKEKRKLAQSNNQFINNNIYAYKKEPNIFAKFFGAKSNYYYFYIKEEPVIKEKPTLLKTFNIVTLYTTNKKSFDESMLNDILFIKQNMVELTKKQANSISPLKIKIINLKHSKNIKDLAEENMPYIYFNEDWFRAINGLYDDLQETIGSEKTLKLIPNPNKDI